MTIENKSILISRDFQGRYDEEIRCLFKDHNLEPITHLGNGTINHAWLSKDLKSTSYKILVVGPVVNSEPLKSRIDSGYSDADKYIKAHEITDAIRLRDIPAIQFLDAGKISKSDISFAWGVQNEAKGTSLDKIWATLLSDDKMTIVEQIAEYVGNWHGINDIKSSNFEGSAKEWYEKRMDDLICDAKTLHIFNQDESMKIGSAYKKLLNNTGINNTIGLIHGDLFQPNIFVNKEHGKYQVSNIIDWETAIIGHTGYEQILSAWWLAGEHEGNKEIFHNFVKSSSNNGAGYGFAREDTNKAIELVDMLWHVNVIVSCTALRKMTDIPRWLKNLDRFVSLIEQNGEYSNY